jgi:hypothetical protein
MVSMTAGRWVVAGGVLGEVREAMREIVDSVDAEALTVAEARTAVRDFAAIERLAAAGKLLVLRRASGDADWFARETGVSYGQARATLGAADSIADVPEVESALRSGELSETQAREIGPAAAADPSAADELLDSAKNEAFGKTKKRCARVLNAATDDGERAKRVHDARSLRIWQDAAGAGRIEIKGPSPVIARFRALLEPHREAAFQQARREGRRESADAIAFDGLVRWLDAREAAPRGKRVDATRMPRSSSSSTRRRCGAVTPNAVRPARSPDLGRCPSPPHARCSATPCCGS